ncbi:hypothetical protein BO82DRAFT_140452 [Aspergillus uvarum CBS 121591]|uniref:Uncharacterized protein n=1 Tax=Aspergillus uvarum CBS 121591 TaxID=1448315 RepID=A0A319CJM9_9EURO|nr:hypothetical protein BO82DRAFT_140452 [Aspergillus uvarum CBS 121591]PYH85856.1 hypothetical protein BO82DRAFT_140452 [Aspergillus uvarum CBS 121591]
MADLPSSPVTESKSPLILAFPTGHSVSNHKLRPRTKENTRPGLQTGHKSYTKIHQGKGSQPEPQLSLLSTRGSTPEAQIPQLASPSGGYFNLPGLLRRISFSLRVSRTCLPFFFFFFFCFFGCGCGCLCFWARTPPGESFSLSLSPSPPADSSIASSSSFSGILPSRAVRFCSAFRQ